MSKQRQKGGTMDKMEIVKALLCDGPGNGVASSEDPWKIGEKYFIRTVTNYWTGRLIKITSQELLIEDAAWVADTGRFHEAVNTSKLNEVEPVGGTVIIGRGSIVDALVWTHSLPRDVK